MPTKETPENFSDNNNGNSNPSNFGLNEEEEEENHSIVSDPDDNSSPPYDDLPSHMTYGRRISRFLSSHSTWYNPHAKARRKFEEAEAAAVAAGEIFVEEEILMTMDEYGNDVDVEEFKDDTIKNERDLEGADEIKKKLVKPPNLDAGWAYFEHQTLPRYFVEKEDADEEDEEEFEEEQGREQSLSLMSKSTLGTSFYSNEKDLLPRAEPGEVEHPTRLYDVWSTPESELGDFGIGVGTYFSTLKWLSIITFIAGLINLPNIIFFASKSYTGEAHGHISSLALRGSAICDDLVWSACPTCTADDWSLPPNTHDRFAITKRNDGDEELKFILVNNCSIGKRQVMVNYCSLIFVFICIYILGCVTKAQEVKFDEAEQTAQDYSVEVTNPPDEAFDPQEWKNFFSKFGHVTVCTVAVNNYALVNALVDRKLALLQLQLRLPAELEWDPHRINELVPEIPKQALWKRALSVFGLFPSAELLRERVHELEEHITELSAANHHVATVFITFETEQAQRLCLKTLSIPRLDIIWNRKESVPQEYLFQGDKMLKVREPSEPSAIRWHDLDTSKAKKIIQITATTIISLIMIVGGTIIISVARRRSSYFAAIAITVLNSITPTVVKKITKLETHSTEGTMQASQYIKMTLFRWINTAIVTTMITPFADILRDGKGYLMSSIYAIFFAELIKSPLLQCSDLWGNVQRHILAPRAPDQRRVNLNFQGAYWELAERYTDATKVLFLTFFYAAIFPAGFFFAALTLAVHYWTDKFCILRVWMRAPKLGTQIAGFSRSYFFSAAILAFAVLGSYSFASFPYDNACATNGIVGMDSPYHITNQIAFTGPDQTVQINITIQEGQKFYKFCNQDMIQYDPPAFPALPKFQREGQKHMTKGQEEGVLIYGWTSVAILGVVALGFFTKLVLVVLWGLFVSPYRPVGRATNIKYSKVKKIYAYVPQLKVSGYTFPFLLCDVSDIDSRLVGWNDPYRGYDPHNLIFDVPKVSESMRVKEAKALAGTKKKGEKEEEKCNDVVSEKENGDMSENSLDDSSSTPDCPLFSVVKHWAPVGATVRSRTRARSQARPRVG